MPVRIPRPRYVPKSLAEELSLNVVYVREVEPPQGATPVEWLLWSTEPIETAEQVARVVDTYRSRWLIEEFFKALKTGCQIQKREFHSRHALENLVAIFAPIACGLLWLRSQSRSRPDAPATEVFSPLQLELLGRLSSRPMSDKPTIKEAVWALAALAGHQKSNGPPGWLILRRGLEKLQMFEIGWRAARDGQEM